MDEEGKTLAVMATAFLGGIFLVLLWSLVISPEIKAYQIHQKMVEECAAGNTFMCPDD